VTSTLRLVSSGGGGGAGGEGGSAARLPHRASSFTRGTRGLFTSQVAPVTAKAELEKKAKNDGKKKKGGR
jgi:hypothetical protein